MPTNNLKARLRGRSLLLGVSALFASTAAQAKPFDAQSYLDFQQATAAAISPEGATVAYTVAVFDRVTDLQQSQLWAMPVRGGDARLLGNGESPQWCPKIGLVSLKRDGEKLQLQVSDGTSGARPLLPNVTSVQDFACDPSGARLAIVGSEGGSGAASDLLFADVSSGAVTKIIGGANVAGLEWNRAGTAIAASLDDDIEIIGVDGTRTPLVKRPGRDIAPHWSPDGKRIVFATQDGATAGPIALAIVAAAGGEPQPIARSFSTWLRGRDPRWVQWIDDRRLAFIGLSHMRSHLYSVDLKTPAAVTDLTPQVEAISGCSASLAAKSYACVQSSLLTPPQVFLRTFASPTAKALTKLNPALDLAAVETIREVQWRSPDGTEIAGLLAMPTKAPGPLPLVVLNVGSHGTYDHSFTTRVSADDTWFPAINHHVLTAQGYAVLMPNPRGSWGYGSDFQYKVAGDPAVGPFADIEAGVDAMIARGIADPNRLATVATGTYDAYRAVYGLTQTSRYNVAILTVPIVDVVAVAALAPGAFSTRYFGGSPLAEPAKFDAINPIRHTSAIKTPTLIFKVNFPVFESQANLLAAALRENKVPVEVKPASERFGDPSRLSETREAIAAALEWLGKYLKPN